MRDYSNPELEARLRQHSAGQGFNSWFGVECIAAGNGQVELLVEIRPDHLQHHGYVHGGCVSSLADTACAWAGASVALKDVVTSNFTFHFLRPAIGTHLRAYATTLRAGKSQATVEARIMAETEGKDPVLVGTGLTTIAILPDKAAA